MIIIRQKRIERSDLQANPLVLYLFGDNLERKGLGGQAFEMRGESNAFGIATKRAATHNAPQDYFLDEDADVPGIIEGEFKRLRETVATGEYWAIVVPADGIGTGLARLSLFAPNTLKLIEQEINRLDDLCV